MRIYNIINCVDLITKEDKYKSIVRKVNLSDKKSLSYSYKNFLRIDIDFGKHIIIPEEIIEVKEDNDELQITTEKSIFKFYKISHILKYNDTESVNNEMVEKLKFLKNII